MSCSNIAIAVGKSGSVLRSTNSAELGYTEWATVEIGDISVPDSAISGNYALSQYFYDFQAVS